MDSVIDTEQLKKARGLRSLNDVAKELGVTRQQVWNYEKGTSEPPLSVLMKLADLYGVRVEKLIRQKNFVQS
jgi:HTH-type transcriptional regulator, competence development regulator